MSYEANKGLCREAWWHEKNCYFILIDLKRPVKKNLNFSTKGNNMVCVYQNQTPFGIKNKLLISAENISDSRELEEIAEVPSKVKQVCFHVILYKQGFHYDTQVLFDPFTRFFNETSEQWPGCFKTTTAVFDVFIESFFRTITSRAFAIM